jgi:type IV secretion system T-DNA border endonuclease VirD2
MSEDVWNVAYRVPGARAGLGHEAKQRLRRIVRKTPEVMVKVTGRSFGARHMKAHLDYVTRNAKLRAVGGDGRPIEGRLELRALHDEWVMKNELAGSRRDNKVATSVNIMLSMPPGTNADSVERAAAAWAANVLGDRFDYLMTRHDDQKHPHVHITVRAVGFDGRRLRVNRNDLQRWREHFAEKLRERGVEAEATPRAARGRSRRAERQVVRQLKERGILPRVEEAARREILQETRSDRKPETRPWDDRIERRRVNVLAAYAAHAAELDKGDDADRQLAGDIRRFVAGMPMARTRRQELETELTSVLAARFAEEAERVPTARRRSPEPER